MLMNPDFGNAVYDLLFEPIIANGTQAVICQHIKEDIEKYETRVTVKSVSLYSTDYNERIINLTVQINLTNEVVDLAFPFSS